MVAIWATSAGFACLRFDEDLLVEEEEEAKKKYRTARAERAARRRREGIERVCCWSDIGEVCWRGMRKGEVALGGWRMRGQEI